MEFFSCVVYVGIRIPPLYGVGLFFVFANCYLGSRKKYLRKGQLILIVTM